MIRRLFLVATAGLACSGTAVADFLARGADRLYYESVGDGFPLVLVSGGSGMDLRQWDAVVPELNRHYRVIRYDPRGVGRSDNPSESYADSTDLIGLLDHLGIRKIGLIGLSSAGGFVLEFALGHPERLTGVVAVAPFVPGFEFSASMQARLDTFNRAAGAGREIFIDAMFADPYFIPAPLDRSVRVPARQNMGQNFDKRASFDPGLSQVLEPPLIEQLQDIRPPVLLLAGTLDHPDVLLRNDYIVERLPRASAQTVGEAGHNLPTEDPPAFIDATREFLEQISGN